VKLDVGIFFVLGSLRCVDVEVSLTFRRYMLPPSAVSKLVRRVNVHVYCSNHHEKENALLGNGR
jgi:hypothetical protein